MHTEYTRWKAKNYKDIRQIIYFVRQRDVKNLCLHHVSQE